MCNYQDAANSTAIEARKLMDQAIGFEPGTEKYFRLMFLSAMFNRAAAAWAGVASDERQAGLASDERQAPLDVRLVD